MATIFSDDFAYGTGTVAPGVPWDANKWSTYGADANSTIGAFNGYGRLANASTTTHSHQLPTSYAAVTDEEVFLRFYKSNAVNPNNWMVKASGPAGLNTLHGRFRHYGYMVTATKTGTMQVSRVVNSSIVTLNSNIGTYAAATWYRLRIRIQGGELSIRYWDEALPEPTTWNYTYVDANPTQIPAGNLFMGQYGSMHLYTDELSIDDTAAAVVVTPVTFTTTIATGDATALEATGRQSRHVRVDLFGQKATGTGEALQPTVTTSAATPTTVTTTAATGDAAALAPVVQTQATVLHAALTASADGLVVEPTVTAEQASPNFVFTSTPATATAEALDAVVAAQVFVSVTAPIATADEQPVDHVFSNVTSVTVRADLATGNATLLYYSYNDDPFIKVINDEFDAYTKNSFDPDRWFRFGQSVAGPLKNYAFDDEPTVGQWAGTPEFGIRDDYLRPATHFDGDSYVIATVTSGNSAVPMTWEFVFRTTEANTPLASAEWALTSTNGKSIARIQDGRFAVGSQSVTNLTDDVNMFSALGRVDDGKWHHVMVMAGTGTATEAGFEIFIDGESRLKRITGTSAGQARPSLYPAERIGADYAGNTFKGDLLMFAQYNRKLKPETAMTHALAYRQATAIKTTVATGTAESLDHKGRGNALRAIAFYTQGGAEPTGLDGFSEEDYNWTGIRLNKRGSDGFFRVDASPFNYGPYRVFPRKLDTVVNEYDLSQRLQNLDDVTDLEDYDMFFFIDVPYRDGYLDYDNSTRLEEEVFVQSIRNAIDRTGIAFWCPQPELAVELGFIDTLDTHSFDRENNDVESFENEDAGWLSRNSSTKASWYKDTHYNNRYRVTANVEGFTDLEGHNVVDYVHWYNILNPFSARPDYVKYNLQDLTGRGLRIGDHVYMPTDLADPPGSSIPAWHWRRFIRSVPNGAYRGTAVAKEQATINMQGEEVPNPYAENALTILIEPGTSVNGSPIGGKVLIDFMSGYNSLATIDRAFTELGYAVEHVGVSAEDLFDGYDFDSRRSNAFFSWLTSSVEYVRNGATRIGTTEVPIYTETDKYGLIFRGRYNWLSRGFNWLGKKTVTTPGSVTARPAVATAVGEVRTPAVEGQKHVTVATNIAAGQATIIRPAQDESPDVSVTAFIATASATALALQKVNRVQPASGSGAVIEPTVSAEGFDFVLSLRAPSTYYVSLKEDA